MHPSHSDFEGTCKQCGTDSAKQPCRRRAWIDNSLSPSSPPSSSFIIHLNRIYWSDDWTHQVTSITLALRHWSLRLLHHRIATWYNRWWIRVVWQYQSHLICHHIYDRVITLVSECALCLSFIWRIFMHDWFVLDRWFISCIIINCTTAYLYS